MALADLERIWESYSSAIILGFVMLLAAVFVLKARGNLRRFKDQQAQRQAVAASLGFRARGGSPWEGALATIADGTEALGPFPRLTSQPRVRIQLEGDRRGLKTTIFLHRPDTEPDHDTSSTIACFASPEIDVPAFRLERALAPFPPAVEAVLGLAARALKPVFGSPDPVIAFPDRPRFGELYSLTSTFTVRIRDAFPSGTLEFFEEHPGWSVEGLNGRLLVWREDVREPPERLSAFLAEAAAVAEVFRKS